MAYEVGNITEEEVFVAAASSFTLASWLVLSFGAGSKFKTAWISGSVLAAAVLLAYAPTALRTAWSRLLPLLSGPVAVAGLLVTARVAEDLGLTLTSLVGGLLLGSSLVCATESLTGRMSESLSRTRLAMVASLVSAGVSLLFLLGLILAMMG